MPRKLNLIGKRFGKLVIIESRGINNNRKPIWMCECDCGKQAIVATPELRSGDTKSCGCYKKQRISDTKRLRLDGMKFGLLTVVGYAGNSKNSYDSMWLCKCVCGNNKIVRGRSLIKGDTKSCGCMTATWISEKVSVCASNRLQDKTKNPMYGKRHSDKTRQLISDKRKGKNIGDNNPAWRGGVSFEPYCPRWNDNLRNRIRTFFDHKCVMCGGTDYRKLSCHHVEYNKNACCDGKPVHFIALCTRCHNRTHHNREQWENIFHVIIDEIYNGKSYYTKEEFKEISICA